MLLTMQEVSSLLQIRFCPSRRMDLVVWQLQQNAGDSVGLRSNSSLLCCLPIAHTVLNVDCTQCMRAFAAHRCVSCAYTRISAAMSVQVLLDQSRRQTFMRPNPMDFGCSVPAIPVHSNRISVRERVAWIPARNCTSCGC